MKLGNGDGVSAKRGDLVFIHSRLNGYKYWEPFRVTGITRDGAIKEVADSKYGTKRKIDRLLIVTGSMKYIISKEQFDVDSALNAYANLEDFTSLETENDARNFISKFRYNQPGKCGIIKRLLGRCDL